MAVEIAAVGRPRKLPRQLPRISSDLRGDCRVAMAMAADGRGNCHGSFRGKCRGKTAVAIAAEFRWLPWSVRRIVPRIEARHVPRPQPWHLPWKCHELWHLPWKPAEFHGSPWQHPRNFTEDSQSLPRTSAKSQIICIREEKAGIFPR